MSQRIGVIVFMIAAILPGCGRVAKPVTGGTAGVLHAGVAMLSDIQVTVHQVEGSSSKPIGFGVVGVDGSFQLALNEAKGPLTLAPGEYRCTLESVGAPVVILKEYTQPDTTPLKITWSTGDCKLDLDIPPLKPSK